MEKLKNIKDTQTTHRWCVIYATHILGIKGFKESYVFIVSSLELLYRKFVRTFISCPGVN